MGKKNGAIVIDDVSADEITAGEIDESADEGYGDTREMLPRDKALAAIALEAERHNGIDRDQIEDIEPLEQSTPQLTRTGPADPLADLGFYRNAADTLVTKIKVNGEEREITAEQYKNYIQKELAGDLKLQQASERERGLTQREQQLAQAEQKLRQNMTQTVKPSEQDAAKTRQRIKAALENVYDGDLDGATESLMTVVMERGNATLTSAQLQPLIEQTVADTAKRQETTRQQTEWTRSVDEGNRNLAVNHPEIYKDPTLFDLVNGETVRLLQRRNSGDPEIMKLNASEIIAKAADEVTQWLGQKRGTVKSYQDSRQTRKGTLRPVVTGKDRGAQIPATPQKDMSPNAVINRMAASRASSTNRG